MSENTKQLTTYKDLLRQWQKRMNLVAPSTLSELETRHFKDSGQLKAHLPDTASRIYDLGSGAGFPGLVLAISCPEREFHLIESNRKKAAFLQTVRRTLGLANVIIHAERIEDCVARLAPPDLITARALAELKDILHLTKGWRLDSPGPDYLLLKGQGAEKEIARAKESYSFDIQNYSSQTQSGAHILHLSCVE